VSNVPPILTGLVDDAAIFPPGNSPLAEAVEAFAARRDEWYAGLVGAFVVSDHKLPEVARAGLPVSVVITGGAGAIAGVARLAGKAGTPLAGLEIALRDLDDLAGNARRVVAAVDAARADGTLDDDTPIYVELPHAGSTASWLAAADAVAESGLRLKFRTGGLEAELFPHPHALASWIDAALDRETPFKCTAGLHHAVAHTDPETGFEHHGFLNVLVATRTALDGGSAADVLTSRDGAALATATRELPASTRTWFTSFGSCSITDPLADLTDLNLMEAP